MSFDAAVAVLRARTHEELLAIGLRATLGLGHRSIDPVAVARSMGFEVVRHPVADATFGGAYQPVDGGLGAILVNSASPVVRQRFTVSHEIGHALLHAGTTAVDDDIESPSDSQAEREADRFAGALLVHLPSIPGILAEHQGELDPAVAATAERFEVSVEAAAAAIEQAGMIDRAARDEFLARFATTDYAPFMQRHDRRSTYLPGDSATELDPAYRARVLQLLRRGQVDPERAAQLLITVPDELPPEDVGAWVLLGASDGDTATR